MADSDEIPWRKNNRTVMFYRNLSYLIRHKSGRSFVAEWSDDGFSSRPGGWRYDRSEITHFATITEPTDG